MTDGRYARVRIILFHFDDNNIVIPTDNNIHVFRGAVTSSVNRPAECDSVSSFFYRAPVYNWYQWRHRINEIKIIIIIF